jgi:YfiH family protein
MTTNSPPSALPSGWMTIDFGAHLQHRVGALMSARAGGVSRAPYAHCNLGDHVNDEPQAVVRNREVFGAHLQSRPVWLTQVHGNRVIRLTHGLPVGDVFNPADHPGGDSPVQPQADGAITTEPGLACTVMVADCLPVLLAAPDGRGVAALHAGWRGLAGAGGMAGRGIVHSGIEALCEAASCDPHELQAWLGPCIGARHFEVGPDVLIGFGVDPGGATTPARFTRCHQGQLALPDGSAEAKWLADLPGLAGDILLRCGVHQVSGGTWCTTSDRSRFFSFRRDSITGRQAAGICLRG